MATKEIKVPNIGGASDVEVIEVLVSPGDKVKKEDSLITLESDKASMEIPSPDEGTVEKINVKVGDKVSEGSLIIVLKTEEAEATPTEKSEQPKVVAETKKIEQAPAKSSEPKELKVTIPDIGDAKDVEVIEVLVKPGSQVQKEESLITLEGEKATMEIPSPYAGEIKSISLKVGDKVSKGDEILTMMAIAEGEESKVKEQEPTKKETQPAAEQKSSQQKSERVVEEAVVSGEGVHAGPGVRRIAREFGVDLTKVKGTGPKNRILKEDLQQYVKNALREGPSGGGLQIPKMPDIDFSKFGKIEEIPLSKIKKLTGINVHRSWVTIPHVTQFGLADITELEAFRNENKSFAEQQGVKLTPLVFIMKAVVAALKEFPHFNASLDSKGEKLILKKYYNLGIAVDTPNGLVVPVVRDADQKGMIEIAKELADTSHKAREKGLSITEMSGSSFTISSLGGIGGTSFTPIINAPDVAILGVSKASMMPQYVNGQFVPRLMLPLSLSYDHRVIDGADGARFIVYLTNYLSDTRTLLL